MSDLNTPNNNQLTQEELNRLTMPQTAPKADNVIDYDEVDSNYHAQTASGQSSNTASQSSCMISPSSSMSSQSSGTALQASNMASQALLNTIQHFEQYSTTGETATDAADQFVFNASYRQENEMYQTYTRLSTNANLLSLVSNDYQVTKNASIYDTLNLNYECDNIMLTRQAGFVPLSPANPLPFQSDCYQSGIFNAAQKLDAINGKEFTTSCAVFCQTDLDKIQSFLNNPTSPDAIEKMFMEKGVSNYYHNNTTLVDFANKVLNSAIPDNLNAKASIAFVDQRIDFTASELQTINDFLASSNTQNTANLVSMLSNKGCDNQFSLNDVTGLKAQLTQIANSGSTAKLRKITKEERDTIYKFSGKNITKETKTEALNEIRCNKIRELQQKAKDAGDKELVKKLDKVLKSRNSDFAIKELLKDKDVSQKTISELQAMIDKYGNLTPLDGIADRKRSAAAYLGGKMMGRDFGNGFHQVEHIAKVSKAIYQASATAKINLEYKNLKSIEMANPSAFTEVQKKLKENLELEKNARANLRSARGHEARYNAKKDVKNARIEVQNNKREIKHGKSAKKKATDNKKYADTKMAKFRNSKIYNNKAVQKVKDLFGGAFSIVNKIKRLILKGIASFTGFIFSTFVPMGIKVMVVLFPFLLLGAVIMGLFENLGKFFKVNYNQVAVDNYGSIISYFNENAKQDVIDEYNKSDASQKIWSNYYPVFYELNQVLIGDVYNEKGKIIPSQNNVLPVYLMYHYRTKETISEDTFAMATDYMYQMFSRTHYRKKDSLKYSYYQCNDDNCDNTFYFGEYTLDGEHFSWGSMRSTAPQMTRYLFSGTGTSFTQISKTVSCTCNSWKNHDTNYCSCDGTNPTKCPHFRCAIFEHTHGDGHCDYSSCNIKFDNKTIVSHIHNDDCFNESGRLICKKATTKTVRSLHTHTDSCCNKTQHTHNFNDCCEKIYICDGHCGGHIDMQTDIVCYEEWESLSEADNMVIVNKHLSPDDEDIELGQLSGDTEASLDECWLNGTDDLADEAMPSDGGWKGIRIYYRGIGGVNNYGDDEAPYTQEDIASKTVWDANIEKAIQNGIVIDPKKYCEENIIEPIIETKNTVLDLAAYPLLTLSGDPDYDTFARFGSRNAPGALASSWHKGWDIGGDYGAKVQSILAGKIVGYDNSCGEEESSPSAGKYITVEHYLLNPETNEVYSFQSQYCHGSKLLKTGGYVGVGETIMLCGYSGASYHTNSQTGAKEKAGSQHLHFALKYLDNGTWKFTPPDYVLNKFEKSLKPHRVSGQDGYSNYDGVSHAQNLGEFAGGGTNPDFTARQAWDMFWERRNFTGQYFNSVSAGGCKGESELKSGEIKTKLCFMTYETLDNLSNGQTRDEKAYNIDVYGFMSWGTEIIADDASFPAKNTVTDYTKPETVDTTVKDYASQSNPNGIERISNLDELYQAYGSKYGRDADGDGVLSEEEMSHADYGNAWQVLSTSEANIIFPNISAERQTEILKKELDEEAYAKYLEAQELVNAINADTAHCYNEETAMQKILSDRSGIKLWSNADYPTIADYALHVLAEKGSVSVGKTEDFIHSNYGENSLDDNTICVSQRIRQNGADTKYALDYCYIIDTSFIAGNWNIATNKYYYLVIVWNSESEKLQIVPLTIDEIHVKYPATIKIK